MQLDLIIAALRTRVGAFNSRVAGAAQFKVLQEATALPVPQGFVVPLDDSPDDARSQNGVRQDLKDSFAVIVAVTNVPDEKGQTAQASIHQMRGLLWAALLGWRPAPDYDGIVYEGGHLLALDRARLWYQFEFSARMEIGPEDGYQQIELVGLPHFDGVDMKIDVIDPIAKPAPGPDGRVEFVVPIPPTGSLPP